MADGFHFCLAGQPGRSATPLEVRTPYDGQVVGRTWLAGDEEFDKAADAAVAAAEPMRGLATYERSEILVTAAAWIHERREPIARTLAGEAGKPLRDARTEVERATQTFRAAADEAKRIAGEVVPMDLAAHGRGRIAITRRFPVGPVAAISPSNFPLNLSAHKVAPAIAAGNPIVLKPATKTPLSALYLAQALVAAGLPPGAISVMPMGRATGDRLVTDPRFRLLTFTGSSAVGWDMKARAGKKKVILELGGNAGVIVDASAPLDEGTDVGPMIHEGETERIDEWIGEAVTGGARVLTGGRRLGGAMYAPTVLTDVPDTARVCTQEVFAPLVSLFRVASFEQAVEAVNRSTYGLQAGIFTSELEHTLLAFDRIEAGGLIVNDVPTWRIDHMPYGGVKDSGLGREGPRYTIEEMTEPRLLVINRAIG